MNSLERILVATDLSETSRLAIRRGAALAAEHGAAIELIHVARQSAVLPDWLARAQPRLADEASLEADLRGRLTAMALDAGLDGTAPNLTVTVRFGKTAQELAAHSLASEADLLVAGAHGEGGSTRTLLGTTAQKLVRISSVPVLVARRDDFAPYAQVLVGTDFSASSAAAARLARRLAPNARMECLHAYDMPYFTLMTHSGIADDAMADYRRLAHEDARVAMQAFMESLGPDLAEASSLLRHGYAPALIEQHVREQGCDLVAVGAEGKGAVGAALLGSVSARVLLGVSSDVLVTRADAED